MEVGGYEKVDVLEEYLKRKGNGFLERDIPEEKRERRTKGNIESCFM